jgi:tRNA/tmRNA/rRNA uracil-C5-methylase (TrmA/RlmC/RlmD family)
MSEGPHAWVGRELVVDVGPVAHGGHCVARHEGRVVFVRHGVPGERVRIRVTEGHEGSRYLRADVIEIERASADRVTTPCPHAGPARCGGCDFQHISLPAQRRLLAAVVSEQLFRLAGLDTTVEVEAVAGDQAGLGWRTRVRFSATPEGGLGLKRHRSHTIEPIARCVIGHPDLPDVREALRAGAGSAKAVVSSSGDRVVVTERADAPEIVENALGRAFRLQAGDFWQVHPGAAEALASAVVEGLEPGEGERCWDLFAGVGLFSAALAPLVGEGGRVIAVDSHGRATRHGRENLADLPQVRWVDDRVNRFVKGRIAQGRLDLVVLDPPRAGAGREIVEAIARQHPRGIAYVACDPASLARDLKTLQLAGYRLDSLRAFDIFPMTHHVECVAICRPDQAS